MTTLADLRPWADSDDPAEYADFPTAWPHDSQTCPVCRALGIWEWFGQFQQRPSTGDRSRQLPGWRRAAHEAFERSYPRRFRAAIEHRRLVRRSSRQVPMAVRQAREEASKFLVGALAEARRQHLVPREGSRNQRGRFDGGPWPSQWPCREIAGSETGVAFVSALRTAYPSRFPDASKFPYKDPEQYVAAFLRAVIADSIVSHGPLRAKSPSARSMFEELHRVCSIDGQRFTCLWLIDDVDFTDVDATTVGEVTLRSEAASRPENVVSSLLPEAMWVSADRLRPSAKTRGGYFVASKTTNGDLWSVWGTLNDSMDCLVTALRLGTATTGPTRMVWIGEPSMVHVQEPEAHPQTGDFGESYWRRVGVVTRQNLSGLGELAALVAKTRQLHSTKRNKQGTLPSVAVAMGRYARTFTDMNWQDKVLDLATGLEACLGPRDKEEIGLTLRTRAAHLLGHDDSERADAIYRDISDLYGLRSDIIHGRPTFTQSPAKLFEARHFGHILPGDQMQALLDCWRDVLRRAIAARLMLADTRLGEPLWSLFGDDTPVDRSMVRKDKRDEWCERIRGGAAALGLPLLVDQAPPLVDYLHNPVDRSLATSVVLAPSAPAPATDQETD